jgi:hypothetical protein
MVSDTKCVLSSDLIARNVCVSIIAELGLGWFYKWMLFLKYVNFVLIVICILLYFYNAQRAYAGACNVWKLVIFSLRTHNMYLWTHSVGFIDSYRFIMIMSPWFVLSIEEKWTCFLAGWSSRKWQNKCSTSTVSTVKAGSPSIIHQLFDRHHRNLGRLRTGRSTTSSDLCVKNLLLINITCISSKWNLWHVHSLAGYSFLSFSHHLLCCLFTL